MMLDRGLSLQERPIVAVHSIRYHGGESEGESGGESEGESGGVRFGLMMRRCRYLSAATASVVGVKL